MRSGWRPLRGEQLKKLRLAVGASVEDTARALRRTPEELSEIERDNLPVSLLVETRLRWFLRRRSTMNEAAQTPWHEGFNDTLERWSRQGFHVSGHSAQGKNGERQIVTFSLERCPRRRYAVRERSVGHDGDRWIPLYDNAALSQVVVVREKTAVFETIHGTADIVSLRTEWPPVGVPLGAVWA